jgi:hypothetical protein
MIRTTSGTVLIRRAFRSASKSAIISSVMATVIFRVPMVLTTAVWRHRKPYNSICRIPTRALGDIRWQTPRTTLEGRGAWR